MMIGEASSAKLVQYVPHPFRSPLPGTVFEAALVSLLSLRLISFYVRGTSDVDPRGLNKSIACEQVVQFVHKL